MGQMTMADHRINRLRDAGAYDVAARICARHGIAVHDMMSGTRRAPIVRARDHVIAVLRWTMLWSTPHLGAIFGMDHTAILAAVARHERVISEAA